MWHVFRCALFALALLVGPAAHAAGDTTKAELDGLFQLLAKAGDATQAEAAEAQIWEHWLHSGSPSADLLLMRGIEALARGEYATSEQLLSTVIALSPDFAEAWNKRATLYYLQGKYDLSLLDIEHTLALEPRHFGALMGLGRILEEYRQPEKALDAFERAKAIHPFLGEVDAEITRLKNALSGKRI
ncbi:MAG: tetratricopeptide repeat protein [Alphaproteobacteria bacterium]|nr:tetratricopeptide repeat protein [Alphaproteobacteria bacterium]